MLKPAAANRIVPIHPMIARIGFLEYVEKAREVVKIWLFPELPVDGRGYCSDAFPSP